jgi:hypothetical protein
MSHEREPGTQGKIDIHSFQGLRPPENFAPVANDYSTNRETEVTSCMAGTVKVKGRPALFFPSFSIFHRPHFSDSSAISSNVIERSKSR